MMNQAISRCTITGRNGKTRSYFCPLFGSMYMSREGDLIVITRTEWFSKRIIIASSDDRVEVQV